MFDTAFDYCITISKKKNVRIDYAGSANRPELGYEGRHYLTGVR